MRRALIGICPFLVAAGVLGTLALDAVMSAPLDHNEHMYVAAGVLVQQQALYGDFAYLQMPYLPYLLAAVYALSGTSSYLFVGRLVSWFFLSIAALLVGAIAWRVTRSRLLALSGLVTLFTIGPVLRAAQEASNYIAPVALALGAFYAFVAAEQSRRRSSWWFAGSGLLGALAVGFKLYYAPLLLAPFLLLLRRRGVPSGAMVRHRLIPWLAGAFVGILPALALLLRHGGVFVFNNLGFHVVTTSWRFSNGLDRSTVWANKLAFVRDQLSDPATLATVIAAAVGATLLVQARLMRARLATAGWLALLCVLLALASIVVLTPMFIQYMALPLPYLLVLALVADPHPGLAQRALLVGCALVGLTFSNRTLLRFDQPREQWTARTMHRQAQHVGQALDRANARGKVATLAPIFALEGGYPMYSELATGPFLYRVGDEVSPALLQRVHGSSPRRIGELLQQDPPAAVLVGLEGRFDQPLLRFAEQHGYLRFPARIGEQELFIRPGRSSSRSDSPRATWLSCGQADRSLCGAVADRTDR